MIDCQNEAEALEMAAKLPVLEGSVEVRPVVLFD